MFQIGDRVTYKGFVGLPPEQQNGNLWHGPALRPQGYLVRDVRGEGPHREVYVETHDDLDPVTWSYAEYFSLIKMAGIKRNLPEWW